MPFEWQTKLYFKTCTKPKVQNLLEKNQCFRFLALLIFNTYFGVGISLYSSFSTRVEAAML